MRSVQYIGNEMFGDSKVTLLDVMYHELITPQGATLESLDLFNVETFIC